MNEATNSKASAPQDAGTGLLGSLLSNPQLLERAGGILSAALAGKENVMRAYEVAVKERYRFFSFGDSMFIQ